jgi:hypothetical protein
VTSMSMPSSGCSTNDAPHDPQTSAPGGLRAPQLRQVSASPGQRAPLSLTPRPSRLDVAHRVAVAR